MHKGPPKLNVVEGSFSFVPHYPLVPLHYSAGINFLLHKQLIVKYTVRHNSHVSRCWKKSTQKPTILQCWKDCYLVFQRDGLPGTLVKDAISAARKSNELGMSVILNYLGEENFEPLSDQKIGVRISNASGSTQC